ncbi:DUF4426 domain-containing protein [Eionea flava]
MKKTLTLLFAITLLLAAQFASAQKNISYELDDHIIYYNVFNSALISADIAKEYNLVRAKNRAYINVAVVKKSGGYGVAPRKLSGIHRNLLQQRFELEFIEIKEATATYYLAPIRFNNEEIIHIDITVQPDHQSKESTFSLTKKLYRD